MPTAQQTIINRKDSPIYISIEIVPEAYELEPGDRLTLIFEPPAVGDAFEIEFINERELVISPMAAFEPTVLINGQSAEGRSWKFKHYSG